MELVLFAFEHGEPGDLFVQKAPASTIETLVAAMKRLYEADNPVRIVGARHGEKLYETLLTREEMLRAGDMGGYYRVSPDDRDLNYDLYFTEGVPEATQLDDYHSHNTTRLDVDGTCEMLLQGRGGARRPRAAAARGLLRAARSRHRRARASSAATSWSRSGGVDDVEAAGFDVDDLARGAWAGSARRRRGLPPRRRQPAAGPGRVPHRQRRVHRGALRRHGRDRRAAGHGVRLVDPGRARQPLRRQQAGGRGRAGHLGATTAAGTALVFRLPNVFGKWGRPRLQLGGRHVLPQHRPRACRSAWTTRTRP